MADLFQPNDGTRPSRLALGQMVTGEIARIEGPALAQFEAEVRAAQESLPAFDFEVLRAASHRVEDPVAGKVAEEETPQRGTAWWRSWLVGPAALVAVLLLMVLVPQNALKNRIKGGDTDLSYYLLRHGQVMPGMEKAPLQAGDRIQFTYRADRHETVVLVSVDGHGDFSVFYPEDGQEPVTVIPNGRHVLEGSIELDDAPGPESYVAVFGPGTVNAAMELVQEAYGSGGHEGLQDLAETDPAVAVVVIHKKEGSR